MIFTYSECLSVALVNQHAQRMRRVIFSSVASLTLLYFSTLSHKRHDYGERKKLLNIEYVFLFSLQILSATFLILRRTERDIIKNVYWSSCKVSLMFGRFQCH
jgi:purine-cytosine permease-like protein